MTSVNAIFFMGGPQLGELEAGLVATLFASTAVGVTVSVVSGGLATFLIAALVVAIAPAVRRYDWGTGDGATRGRGDAVTGGIEPSFSPSPVSPSRPRVSASAS